MRKSNRGQAAVSDSKHSRRSDRRGKLRRAVEAVEALENRTFFAFDTTLSLAATAGVTVSNVAGTTTFTSTAPGANVSWFDVATAMNGGNNVVVDSGAT